MSKLYKTARMTIRWSPDQFARIERAAKIESRRRGELIEPGALVREVTMPRIEEILAAAEVPS